MVDAVDLSCYKGDTADKQTDDPLNVVQSRRRFSIRAFKSTDLDAVLDFAKRFHSESDFSQVKFNADKTKDWIEFVGTQDDYCFLCAFDEQQNLIGFSAYTLTQYFFSNDYVIVDVAAYIIPEWRKTTLYPRMIQQTSFWGKSVGADFIHTQISSNINTDDMHKMFLRNGYICVGGTYRKAL